MAVLFSAREIVDAAIEKEKKRKGFYSTVAGLSRHQKMADLFRFLTDEEAKHIETFTRIRDRLPQESAASTYIAETYTEEMQAYMDAVIDDHLYAGIDTVDFVRQAIDANTVFRLAIGFEKDAILYFREFLPYLSEEDRAVLERLIEEEKGHIRRLAMVKKQFAG